MMMTSIAHELKTARTERRRRARHVWQVVYMDLLTTVTVFFILAWSITRGKEGAVRHSFGDRTARMVSLPGDVLFPSGKAELSAEGQGVFSRLLRDDAGAVLHFDMGRLVHRQLVIHGHTDSDGAKDDNLFLGYRRALSVYKEIQKYSPEIADHVVLCTHADNSPAAPLPLPEAKAKNRRITIEDQLLRVDGEE